MGGARGPRGQRVLRARTKGGRLSASATVVGAAIDRILADYATTYCLRPVRRIEESGTLRWVIDDELMVEVIHGDGGREDVRVHEIGLLSTLKKELRSRRVSVEYVEKL